MMQQNGTSPTTPEQTHNAYYLTQENELIRNHIKLMSVGADIIHDRYEETFAASLINESLTEFIRLIPEIPYIGGRENPLTETLIQVSSLLALYRVMKRSDRSLGEIGDLVYQLAETWIKHYPRLVRSLFGRLYVSKYGQGHTRQNALTSQERRYSGDFVYEVIEGDGETFDWGVNYLECGVAKFFRQQGAEEFTPYMCLIDYLLFLGLGIRLKRQGTIAEGDTHCDFRFKRCCYTHKGRPPKFLQEQQVNGEETEEPDAWSASNQ